MTEPAGRAPETAQTLDRGLQILQLLASPSGHGGMTISQLADHLGVGRAVVYRLVATLVAREFASRGPDGRVRLGIAGARLSVAVRPMLVEAARPVLRQLADEAGATAHLTIAEGNEALALLVVEPSWTDFHVAYRVGSRHPLDRGAAGRALSAPVGTYVCTQGELQPGAHGLAAPVAGVPGLVGSVGVVMLGPLDRERVGPRVLAAAAEVAKVLR